MIIGVGEAHNGTEFLRPIPRFGKLKIGLHAAEVCVQQFASFKVERHLILPAQLRHKLCECCIRNGLRAIEVAELPSGVFDSNGAEIQFLLVLECGSHADAVGSGIEVRQKSNERFLMRAINEILRSKRVAEFRTELREQRSGVIANGKIVCKFHVEPFVC